MKNLFRFWDTQTSTMITWEDIENNPDINLQDCFSLTRFIKQQCIGIKDKNGKLIYEGDLLLPISEDDDRIEVVWNQDKARFGLMIQWTDPCYWNGLYDEVKTSRDYYDLDDFYTEEFDIIGNIYESVVE